MYLEYIRIDELHQVNLESSLSKDNADEYIIVNKIVWKCCVNNLNMN